MGQSILASRVFRAWSAASIVLLVILVLSVPYPSQIELRHLGLSRSNTKDVYNRTLGFQKVFALGFSSRTDKRDALAVASSFSEFDLTWMEGVRFEDMPEKAIPEIFSNRKNLEGFPDRAIGTWRAHLNVLQRMVNENIQTALVLEDDNDWDVNIKAQLEEFAKGASLLQQSRPTSSPRGSPYGDHWDTLWVGHCKVGPHDTGLDSDEQDMYMIENDTTVPPYPVRHHVWTSDYIMPEVLSNDTRIVFRAGSGLCMWGHAITLQAARKVITWLSVEERKNRQIDVALSQMLEEGDLEGYGIYPPLLSSHRFAGSSFRDSDLRDHDKEVRHDAFTSNVVYSATLNLVRLVEGAEDVASQWPNHTIPNRRLDEKYNVSGKVQKVNLLQYEAQTVPGVNSHGELDMQAYRRLVSEITSHSIT